MVKTVKETQVLAEMENQEYNYALNPADYVEPSWDLAKDIITYTPFAE